ncbi:DNA polymerase III subunit beta [Motilimonas eburnea]|uniref:DNA polymerase III subunit beta n=1 Tax=Motilimonas eburnea TaxID=1737488 RepID=UPI001E4E4533|nr:DNA polymerase III subunit beta [Motilimonas eburnea]MCE2573025.1 DNA polymerase III subunit beta [Motilimonas eburnea]
MHFSINREALLRPLQLVTGALGSRPTLPILGNVLIEVSDNLLCLTGTDLEVELIGQMPLEGEVQPGRTTVPARKLLDICRGLPDQSEIRLTLENEKVILRSGRSRYTLSSLPANDFPNIESWQSIVEFSLPQSQMRRLIESTQFSMASQDVRYYLNGMYFETDGHELKSVATDGHRLAMCSVKLEQALQNQSIIVPRKGVLELIRLLDNDDQALQIQIGSNNIRAITAGFTFTCKLVDGRFPDYRRVIPDNGDKVLSSGREELKQAFARAAILSNEKFRGVRLTLSENLLKITANNPEREEAEEILDVSFPPHDLEIGFNVSYVLDVLNTLKCERIKFTMRDANSSALIEADEAAEQGADAMYVVMPMRL